METANGKKSQNTAGLRRGGGRPKGAKNKATAEIRKLAQAYGPEALETLAHMMRKGKSERVRVAAASELLDRAYGKSPVSVDHTTDGNPLTQAGGVLIVPAGMSVEDWEKLAAGGAAGG